MMKQAQPTRGHDHAIPAPKNTSNYDKQASGACGYGANALAAAVTAASPMEPPGCTRYLTPNLNASQKHANAGGSVRQGY